MANESSTYEIPEWRMAEARKRVDRLNRRADKLGCPPVNFEILETVQRPRPEYAEKVAKGVMKRHEVPQYTAYIVELSNEGPKLAGWTFLGTLDHNTLPGSVIVKTVPGQTIPEEFFHGEATCHHCNKIRRRTETFVVQHENGEYKKVGRNCIRDFLGHDPSALLRFLQSMYKFSEFGDEEFRYGGGGSFDYTYDHVTVLAVTTAIIRTNGWVSKTMAMNDERLTPTAGMVMYFFNPPHSGKELQAYRDWRETIDWRKDEDRAEAEAAMEWLAEQMPRNEYIHNLQNIMAADMVPSRMFGFWCSLIAAYQRAQERLRIKERENADKLNEWVGEVKVRQDFTVEVVSIKHLDGAFGVVHLHRMMDDKGRTLIWFANTRSDMRVDHKYTIKGTVKKHDEYNGWKQTSLSRVKVVEELE